MSSPNSTSFLPRIPRAKSGQRGTTNFIWRGCRPGFRRAGVGVAFTLIEKETRRRFVRRDTRKPASVTRSGELIEQERQ